MPSSDTSLAEEDNCKSHQLDKPTLGSLLTVCISYPTSHTAAAQQESTWGGEGEGGGGERRRERGGGREVGNGKRNRGCLGNTCQRTKFQKKEWNRTNET